MKKVFVKSMFSFLAIILFACKSADNNITQIAGDFCNCFSNYEKSLSQSTKQILADASNAADPEKSLRDNVVKLGEEEGRKVSEEMSGLGDIENEGSEVGQCIKKVEKKYDNAYTFNEDETAQKLIKELEAMPGCGFTGSLIKVGLKMKEKPGSN